MIPARIRFSVLERDEFTCQYCGAKAPNAVLHVDHIIAASNGGMTHPENLVTACSECNFGKSAKDLRFTPDHIIERAGSSYARGIALRESLDLLTGSAIRVGETPVPAPNEVVHAVKDESHAIRVSLAAAGISQEFLAGAIGKSPGYASLLAHGKRSVPSKLIDVICAATGSMLLKQVREREDEKAADKEAFENNRLASLMREFTS